MRSFFIHKAVGSLKTALTCSLFMLLIGCLYFHDRSVDVTDYPAWWGKLHRDDVVQLEKDELYNGVGISRSFWMTTGPSGKGENITVEQFKADRSRYSRWPEIQLLPRGTKMSCTKLARFFSIEVSSYVMTLEILDGEFKGKNAILSGGYLFGNARTKGSLALDPEFFKPAQK
jgi:hypothetical protein